MLKKNIPQSFEVVSVAILDPDGEPARFTVSIIGLPIEKLQLIGSDRPDEGSMPVRIALGEQRDAEGWSLLEEGYRPVSMFHCRQLALEELQPPKPIYRSSLSNDFD